MIPFGVPEHRYPDDLSDDARAAWLVELVDHGDGRAVVAMPCVSTASPALDELEDEMRRALELVRANGRDVVVSLVCADDRGGPTDGASRIVVFLLDRGGVDDAPEAA